MDGPAKTTQELREELARSRQRIADLEGSQAEYINTLKWKTALLEAQVNTSLDAILVIDAHKKRLIINDRVIKLWNIPQNILDDQDDTKLLHYVVSLVKSPEQFLEKVMYLYDHPYETGRDEIEFKDGMVLDRYSAPVIGNDGYHYGRIWTFRDVTDRKRAEEALWESEQRLRHLTDNLPNAMLYQAMAGADGAVRFTYLSSGIERLNELSAEDVFANPRILYRQMLPEYLAMVKEREKQAISTLTTFHAETLSLLPSGRLKWFEYISTPRRLADGTLVWDGVELDVTDRKQAELALMESENSLRSMINATDEVLFLTDIESRILVANNRFEHIIGKNSSDVIGTLLYYHLESRDVFARAYVDVMMSGKPVDFIHAQNDRYFEMTIYPVRGDKGEIIKLAIIAKDMTERRLAEEERERLIGSLNEALSQVKILSGFIPICASCKKIRDDEGYWEQIEVYLSKHSEMLFSHSICPECKAKLYPQLSK